LQLHVTDKKSVRPVTVVLHILAQIRQQHAEEFEWRLPHFDHLMGTDEVREDLERGTAVSDITDSWTADLTHFQTQCRIIRLYPN
jgi:uncharacterized protein YbbC (DUF1343 family)